MNGGTSMIFIIIIITDTVNQVSEIAAHESALDPSISSLSNDKSMKSISQRRQRRRICALLGKSTHPYIDFFSFFCEGILDPRLSLTFMHQVMHPQRQKGKRGKKKK